MNIIKHFRLYLRYKRAVRIANRRFSETGQRQYVISDTKRKKLIIVERKTFRLLKRKGYIPQSANIGHLITDCYYHTPYANGTGAMPPDRMMLKKQAYYHDFA